MIIGETTIAYSHRGQGVIAECYSGSQGFRLLVKDAFIHDQHGDTLSPDQKKAWVMLNTTRIEAYLAKVGAKRSVENNPLKDDELIEIVEGVIL